MNKIPPIIEKYVVPLIWGQKNDEQPIGPFTFGHEASRAAGIKSLSSVGHVLNNKLKTANGYRFYYQGKKTMVLHIPNVRYAKDNDLLSSKRPLPLEFIKDNMNMCGFDVITYGEYDGVQTRIVTKCCNINCDNPAEKRYSTYITSERLPLCESCAAIVKSVNVSKKRPIVAIKDNERLEFQSVSEAGRQLNIPHRTVYNLVKNGNTHSSGYRFEFLD